MNQSHFIYLHGFASGSNSYKAQVLSQFFQQIGQKLIIPDFNQDDFKHLTLTRQLHQLRTITEHLQGRINLIGSSFGGLTAALYAENDPRISKLVLLAPAFNFLTHWLPTFSPTDLTQWKKQREYPVYHYAKQEKSLLAYDFIEDLREYDDCDKLKREIPTLIFHGTNDETIPITSSQDYVQNKAWARLVPMQSDHGLANVIPQIWQQLSQFLQLESLADSSTDKSNGSF